VSLYDPAAWRLRAVEIQMMLNACTERDIRAILTKLLRHYERLAVLTEGRTPPSKAGLQS
jgi:hypothetical protein